MIGGSWLIKLVETSLEAHQLRQISVVLTRVDHRGDSPSTDPAILGTIQRIHHSPLPCEPT